jgi:hypothetical protein
MVKIISEKIILTIHKQRELTAHSNSYLFKIIKINYNLLTIREKIFLIPS